MNEFVVIVDPMEDKDFECEITILNPSGKKVKEMNFNYDVKSRSLYVDGVKKPMKGAIKDKFHNNFYIAPFVINSLNSHSKFYFATEDKNEEGIMQTSIKNFERAKPNSVSKYEALDPSASKKYLA